MDEPSPASEKKTQTEQTPHELPPWWDVTWGTWSLVAVGACAAGFALWTLLAIRQQGKIMMNADRAVMVVDWENFIHLNPENTGTGTLAHCFNWTVRNCGGGSGFIYEVFSRFILTESLDTLPKDPVYGMPISYRSEPLMSGKQTDPGIYTPLEGTMSYEEVETAHRTKSQVLYAYGFIRYRDIHNRKHETRFGLYYDSAPEMRKDFDRFLIGGPKAYNEYA